MKLKIISDGTVRNTKVVNTSTGEEIENVSRITWECSLYGGVTATIEVDNVALESDNTIESDSLIADA